VLQPFKVRPVTIITFCLNARTALDARHSIAYDHLFPVDTCMVQLSMDMASSSEQVNTDLAAELLVEACRRSCEDYVLTEPLVLGVSGGADSLAMLHLLRRLRGEAAPATLHVAHLNHWFRGKEGKEDAEFVRGIARAWGLSCTIETFDVPNYARRYKLSSEDAARRVRYAFLASLAFERGAAVAVAHNADDQVETLLMSVLRGTGIGGLAGMRMLSRVPVPPQDESIALFAAVPEDTRVLLFRPLLHVWRHQIMAYCKQEDLEPRFDSTNWERIYRRNRVRHDLIPLLQMQYSLAIKDHLYNLSQIAQAEDELVDSVVEAEWKRSVVTAKGGGDVRFESQHFAGLPVAMRRRLTRRAIAAVAGTLQDFTFEHVEGGAAIIAGERDSPRALHLPHGVMASRNDGWGIIARRNDDATRLNEPEVEDRAWPVGAPGTHWVLEVPIHSGLELSLNGGWRFRADLSDTDQVQEAAGDLVALFDYDALAALGPIIIRTRRPGDFIRPLGMDGQKSLQDLMVDAKIPRGLRDSIPIVAIEGGSEVLWVPGRQGRRSRYAPLTEATRRVLQLSFSSDVEDVQE
jgi:tRNA(Ile)-lysidine synthase